MVQRTRAVLVGCGSISRAWLEPAPRIAELEIVGLVDINEQAALKAATEYGLTDAVVGTDLDDVLRRVQPDAVFNLTVPEAHLPVTLKALEHGCHVLTEKPLADTIGNARRLVSAAEGAGRILAVIQNRRYDARIRRLRNFLESGVLGQITTVHSDFFIGAHTDSFRDHLEHPLLLDMAIHTFDAARLISGAEPVSAMCHDWNPAGSWYDGNASVVAVFEMTDGVVYGYRGSWCAEGFRTTWECDWRIIGERGTVKWDGADDFQAEVVAETGGFYSRMRRVEVPPYDAGEKTGGHEGNIREFVRCVQTGGTPETIGADNIQSLAMVFGAIQSAESRKAVEIASLADV